MADSVGGQGSFYWAFGDNSGASSWNEYFAKAGPFTPLFLDDPMEALPPTGMAPLLRELLAEYAATGMPPAYLPAAEPSPAITPVKPPITPPEADPA